MNLVEWVISIAIMLRVVGSTLSLVGSRRRSIMAATNGSQRFGGWNPPLKVVLSLWNGEEMWWRGYAKYKPNVEFVAAAEVWN